jgi:hypothetical protein
MEYWSVGKIVGERFLFALLHYSSNPKGSASTRGLKQREMPPTV